ncbi:Conserved hypothetical periplasmic protein [Flagellimonas lutaonensis]|uniref:Conserved hypothetical periplasmic protein n=2 Tax=Flagellimonas lutaonensis TaxID=516051 RepID=A0A0D5YWX0_9FLAO|nr:Conserved hypothetical periplasmic protein [Allomuricauda lutaonensis]
MKNTMRTLISSLLLFCMANLSAQELHPLEGRWDLVMEFEGKVLPSWLEIRHSGHETMIGRFVFAFGSARPISEVKIDGNNFSFEIPRQWEPEGGDMEFTGTLVDGKLKGTMKYVDGKIYQWTGTPAPDLPYNDRPAWGEPMELFNGTDLTHWHTDREDDNWVVENGILKNTRSGANLISNDTFSDFKLVTEFRYPKGSNSGIYLRGRYELQIADNKGLPASDIYFGGIYGFLEPNENVAGNPGDWQTYEVTLIGRRVTVVANGKTIICDQTIPGITGGALDSNEGEPGPIMIQGDHGPVEFKSFVVTPILESN